MEHYTYDEAGNLTETMDGNGGKIRFLYNSQNRLEQRIDQAGESEYWNYDAEGRCCLYKNRNGQEIAYSYNMLGSLLSRRSLGEESVTESYGYTPEGRLAYAIGGGMRYDYVYDEFGRLSEKKASGRTLLSYTYDEDGRLSSRRDISGKETDYCYDENGLLGSILDNGMEIASYGYTPDGRIEEVTSGPLISSYEYTPEGSLESLNTLKGEEQLVANRYAYDHNGNCICKETLAGVTEYGYDVMNRLSEQSGPFGRECYTYDYADNRTGREWFAAVDVEAYQEQAVELLPDMEVLGLATPLGSERYEYDERNRLVRSILSEGNGGEDIIREYTYDNNGNLLSDGQATYTYDAFNRMEKAELKDGRTQVNRYDAEGLRHEMEENGKLVQFLYSGRNVVAETECDGNIIRYIRGIGLVSSDSEKAKSYYHYACDELGSVTDIVKGAVRKKLEEEKHSGEKATTETAQVLNHYEYDAFGNTVVCEETVSNRFRFAGEQYDTVTGQYYLRARFYNPVIGRFLQEDDYYGDGLNLYAYCRNNPVMYVDPRGHNMESAAYNGTGTPRVVGTKTHSAVAKDMLNNFIPNQMSDLTYIRSIEIEQNYLAGVSQPSNIKGSSRPDILIFNNINNNVLVGDIKTGKAQYGTSQQNRNALNIAGPNNPLGYTFTHQEIKPE